MMKTTWGVLDPPVGNTRLNVVRLVASLLQSNTHSINAELINLNTLGVILVSIGFFLVVFFRFYFYFFMNIQDFGEMLHIGVLSLIPTRQLFFSQLFLKFDMSI